MTVAKSLNLSALQQSPPDGQLVAARYLVEVLSSKKISFAAVSNLIVVTAQQQQPIILHFFVENSRLLLLNRLDK